LLDAGIDPELFLRQPTFTPALAQVVQKALNSADQFYRLAEIGIGQLPLACRPAIRAAQLVYADIGREIARNGINSVDHRAYTSRARKSWLLLRSFGALFWTPQTSTVAARPAAVPLIDAVAAMDPVTP
jgi:phytoene synthase